ncbi:glycosyltransferase [Kaistella jeonii]|uniref:Lipopolysaccharide biosynthesis protein n=1 Tax=Kaistella jeonii TaxID=266749 RepID=A0A0C1D403_9FLAO|nr:glycosyltransferase [Kaistella jeonii]KIA88515.1 lipopolysaccharide biosynthesis protein [Kaistella jeonii]SFC19646.1 Glycosyltransferase involved in cell wall bisynthesis [Kaistella jeonii]VEI97022.1 GDP-mannose-dependent alpha-(1-2)-phosphatidylinositol mannosyltransferase [Kaistella jeonii]
MKILHIINSLETGGAEKLVIETLPLYEEHGITADLLLLNGTNHPFLQELVAKKCCQIFTLGTSSVYHPKNIFGIIPFLKEYDIVHVHLFPAQHYVAIAKMLSGAKSKLIFTEHSTSNRRFKNKIFKPFDKIIYNQYHKIIAITPAVKQKILAHTDLKEEKIIVIENGISLGKIHEASPYQPNEIASNLKQSDILILQVSSFQEPKDQATVIRALVELPDHFKLVFVGNGILRQNAIDVVNRLNLGLRVLFLGIRNDVPRLLKTSDIIVLSSKYEGLSLSSIEGMASGKPFVASDVPGLKEVVSGAGILFPLGDEKQLAEEILHLSNDADHYIATVEKCVARAKEYDICKMVAEHINLYEEILRTK